MLSSIIKDLVFPILYHMWLLLLMFPFSLVHIGLLCLLLFLHVKITWSSLGFCLFLSLFFCHPSLPCFKTSPSTISPCVCIHHHLPNTLHYAVFWNLLASQPLPSLLPRFSPNASSSLSSFSYSSLSFFSLPARFPVLPISIAGLCQALAGTQ